jgi:2-amino-4-hydroxy-6-hydroxymethyldihydropteridine diphosphokinase
MPQADSRQNTDVCAILALGANIPSAQGGPDLTLRVALLYLEKGGVRFDAVSRFYNTPCFPAGAGPDYVNAAVRIRWAGSAAELLALLHEVEAELGRERKQRWGVRVADLDLIAFGDAVAPDRAVWQHWHDLDPALQSEVAPEQLILPHPRLQERAFVLIPAADVAPDWRHPVLGLTITEMRDALPESLRAEVVPMKIPAQSTGN